MRHSADFIIWLYLHWTDIKVHIQREIENPSRPLRGLHFLNNSKGCFICTVSQTEQYKPCPLTSQSWVTSRNGKNILVLGLSCSFDPVTQAPQASTLTTELNHTLSLIEISHEMDRCLHMCTVNDLTPHSIPKRNSLAQAKSYIVNMKGVFEHFSSGNMMELAHYHKTTQPPLLISKPVLCACQACLNSCLEHVCNYKYHCINAVP